MVSSSSSDYSNQVLKAFDVLFEDIKIRILKMSDAKKERICFKFSKTNHFAQRLVSALYSNQNKKSLELKKLALEGAMKSLKDSFNYIKWNFSNFVVKGTILVNISSFFLLKEIY